MTNYGSSRLINDLALINSVPSANSSVLIDCIASTRFQSVTSIVLKPSSL